MLDLYLLYTFILSSRLLRFDFNNDLLQITKPNFSFERLI